MIRSDRNPSEILTGLYRPDPVQVTSQSGQAESMRRLARWLTSQGIHWGTLRSERPTRRMVVYADGRWLEEQVRWRLELKSLEVGA